MRYGLPLQRSMFLQGLYVDDYVGAQKIAAAVANDTTVGEDARTNRELSQAYVDHGVHEKANKAVNFASSMLAWGKLLDGETGIGGSPPEKLILIQFSLPCSPSPRPSFTASCSRS